jgi:transposase
MPELSSDISELKSLVYELLSRVEQLEDENALLRAENTQLKSENALLRTENAALCAQLDKNSKDSHKPPSSDGYRKQPALPQTIGKKTGGQLGHTGHTLKQVENPDHFVIHRATACSCCQKTFSA